MEDYNMNNVIRDNMQEHQHTQTDGRPSALVAEMGIDENQTLIFAERRDRDMAKEGQISSDGSQCGSVFSDDGSINSRNTRLRQSPFRTKYRIRKLTPLECWRLMGFSDDDFHKAEKVNSNTQLYKQAGNSIVVNVLIAIFGQMIPGKEDTYKELATGKLKNQNFFNHNV